MDFQTLFIGGAFGSNFSTNYPCRLYHPAGRAFTSTKCFMMVVYENIFLENTVRNFCPKHG